MLTFVHMIDHNKIRDYKRRRAAIWYCYTKANLTMEEIAGIFRTKKSAIHNTLKSVAKERKEELKNYYK